MCVAVPGKIIEIYDEGPLSMAKIDFGGVTKEACIAWIPEARVGNYVIVHAGFALNIIDEDEAIKTLELMKEVLDNPNTEMTWDTKTAG
ncbi:MAG: HypC/HybG/HupF family hydrogenase formation chaperone [Deltaproteobacteria bacterium]|jgi:hydrogenase expression/formation protein HypC|nr:HypC/HybG/HupF family hydrogenase formation chaperone [Deltaproteobacteria bacterium]MBT4525847.1 HypC/HybG/HupF family hydrogenase formation chaperone [Deltaproteobacteria bacterium]